jgi:hypothetical protein
LLYPSLAIHNGYGIITRWSEEKRHHLHVYRKAGRIGGRDQDLEDVRKRAKAVRGNRPRGRIVSSCAIGYAVIRSISAA